MTLSATDSPYPWGATEGGGLILVPFLSEPRGAHVCHMNLFFLSCKWLGIHKTQQHTHRWQCLRLGATSVALCGRTSRLSGCPMAFIKGMAAQRALERLMN